MGARAWGLGRKCLSGTKCQSGKMESSGEGWCRRLHRSVGALNAAEPDTSRKGLWSDDGRVLTLGGHATPSGQVSRVGSVPYRCCCVNLLPQTQCPEAVSVCLLTACRSEIHSESQGWFLPEAAGQNLSPALSRLYGPPTALGSRPRRRLRSQRRHIFLPLRAPVPLSQGPGATSEPPGLSRTHSCKPPSAGR